MLRHAAACFKTPTNSSQNLALRHAAACCCRWCLVLGPSACPSQSQCSNGSSCAHAGATPSTPLPQPPLTAPPPLPTAPPPLLHRSSTAPSPLPHPCRALWHPVGLVPEACAGLCQAAQGCRAVQGTAGLWPCAALRALHDPSKSWHSPAHPGAAQPVESRLRRRIAPQLHPNPGTITAGAPTTWGHVPRPVHLHARFINAQHPIGCRWGSNSDGAGPQCPSGSVLSTR